MKLLEQFNTKEYASRVFLAYLPLENLVAGALEPIMVGHQIGLAAEDFETTGYCALNYILFHPLKLESGLTKPLFRQNVSRDKQSSPTVWSLFCLFFFFLPTIQVIQNLIGNVYCKM